MFDKNLLAEFEKAGVAAVLTVADPLDAVPAARALLAGGVSVIELTYRTSAASEAIRRIRGEVAGVLVGAGTLLNPGQVEEAASAGAAFGVAPGCNPGTIRAARERGLPFAPGIMTPSEIEIALEGGCRLMKYFPAETAGGLAHLKSVAAPFLHLGVRFIPLGGIDARSLADYLRSPLVACVGGSWLASSELVKARDWDAVTGNAAEAAAIVAACRKA